MSPNPVANLHGRFAMRHDAHPFVKIDKNENVWKERLECFRRRAGYGRRSVDRAESARFLPLKVQVSAVQASQADGVHGTAAACAALKPNDAFRRAIEIG